MAKPALLQPAFVLHSKPFRNTSLWLNLFTLEHGRVNAIARGARRSRGGGKVLLQPFVPLLVNYVGKNELQILRHAEVQAHAYYLTGDALISGLYLNELLSRLLICFDPCVRIFQAYQATLAKIAVSAVNVEPALRSFEKILLRELGFGLCLSREAKTNAPVLPDQYYTYDPDNGFLRLTAYQSASEGVADQAIFSGEHLIAIEQDRLADLEVLRAAKRLLRMALARRLGDKPLHSRRMFLPERVA